MSGLRAGRQGRSGDLAPPLVGAVLGDLDGPRATVDERGRVEVGPGGWRVEWGVGASDRWHVAHEEVAVRQHRIDDAPVYATSMRVPGGDIVQRVAVVNDGVGCGLLLEFENVSPDAVAVGVALRQLTGGQLRGDADHLSLDGGDLLRAERPAGGVVVGTGDPWPAVVDGPAAMPVEVTARTDLAGALVVALPHRQTVRFMASVAGPIPGRWPTPEEVAAGWRTVTAEALDIELPDAALREAWRRILADLVVQAGAPDPLFAAEAAAVLDVAGLPAEADRARATVVAAAERGAVTGYAAVAALRALASRDLLNATSSGLDELAGPLASAAGSCLDAETLGRVARALEPGAPAAADDARRVASEAAESAYQPASPPAAAAATVLSAVVEETPGRLVLVPEPPREWRGQPIDVRGMVTEAGRVSFSVRWHGERPALLWERVGGPDEITLTIPGLDPVWAATDRTGEALLAAPAN